MHNMDLWGMFFLGMVAGLALGRVLAMVVRWSTPRPRAVTLNLRSGKPVRKLALLLALGATVSGCALLGTPPGPPLGTFGGGPVLLYNARGARVGTALGSPQGTLLYNNSGMRVGSGLRAR
jgi:hypothetical protein